MAIQESGYGWTTLAQHTNDILAWKYTTASAAGGRNSWVLDCGATKDRYIVFPDRAQAVDFVAQQLATSDNYAAATDRYRQERAQGAPVVEAIDRWVDDIADPYSSQPEAYRAAIKRVMNNPARALPTAGRRTTTSTACRNRSRRLGAARPPVEPGRRAPRDAAATQEGVGELPATLLHACRTWHVARHTLRDGYITAGEWHEVPNATSWPTRCCIPGGCRAGSCSGPARTRSARWPTRRRPQGRGVLRGVRERHPPLRQARLGPDQTSVVGQPVPIAGGDRHARPLSAICSTSTATRPWSASATTPRC